MAQGFAVWLTGLPASGKSTVAAALAQQLTARNTSTQILDSDELRRVLTPHPTYTAEERDWFYRVIVYIARLLTSNGTNVILAATANRRSHRDWAREAIPHVLEVYVACPLEVCQARDPKGLYRSAAHGQVANLPGLQDPYEPPLHPDVIVHTDRSSPTEAAGQIVAALDTRCFL